MKDINLIKETFDLEEKRKKQLTNLQAITSQIRQLEQKWEILNEEINKISNELNNVRNNCEHIIIYLGGYYDKDNLFRRKAYCVLCGKGKDQNITASELFCEKYVIYASSYLPYLNMGNKKDRDEKINSIELLVLEIISKNPNLTFEELFKELNKTIQLLITQEKNIIEKRM